MKTLPNRDERESAIPPNEALQSLTDALLKAPDISVVAVRLEDEPSQPGYVTIPENFAEHADSWLSREQIKQEIRELDSLRLGVDGHLNDIVYNRINELLDMLNEFD